MEVLIHELGENETGTIGADVIGMPKLETSGGKRWRQR